MSDPARISAVVLAFGAEPHLGDCVESLLNSIPVPEIIVVDNGAADAVARLPLDRITVVQPERNLGFAQGCNIGAASSTGDVLCFVNSDVTVKSDALAHLAARLADPAVGLVSGRLLLGAQPTKVNSIGNPVQYLCFSWAGGLGDDAELHTEATSIASITGATFGVRRAVWIELGGFEPMYFAYGEDLELSLRARLSGYDVVFEPAAISWHWYEFNRNRLKMYLLERNRLITLLTVYERSTLLRIAPIAAVVELGVLGAAIRDGWAGQKVAGWRWILAHRAELAQRRRVVQQARVNDDSALASVLQGPINPPAGFGLRVPNIVNTVLERCWARISSSLDSPRALSAVHDYADTPSLAERNDVD